jgi:periplasmic protein CpxP/Spy
MTDTVKKNKSLISIIIFLLITNLAMLIFFLVMNGQGQRNGHGHDQNGISGLLQKEVGFTKEQLDTYQSLRKGHLDKVHTLFDDLRKAKTDFYDLIYTSQVSDSAVNRAAGVIAEKQKTLDLQMFNHFILVRNICTPGQLPKFDTTIKKVITRMTVRPGKEGR